MRNLLLGIAAGAVFLTLNVSNGNAGGLLITCDPNTPCPPPLSGDPGPGLMNPPREPAIVTPNSSFTAGDINFTGTTITGFLTSGPNGASVTFTPPISSSQSLAGSLIALYGDLSFGDNKFDITYDTGALIQLFVDGPAGIEQVVLTVTTPSAGIFEATGDVVLSCTVGDCATPTFELDYQALLDGSLHAMDNGVDLSDTLLNPPFVVPIPGPGTLAIFGVGLAALGLVRRRKPA